MLWPKKNSYKEFDNEKEFLRLENSQHPPPRKISACGIRNAGKFSCGIRNPGLWNLEHGLRNPESH